jgi:hypothetical protein
MIVPDTPNPRSAIDMIIAANDELFAALIYRMIPISAARTEIDTKKTEMNIRII